MADTTQGDALRPNPQQLATVCQRSSRVWHALKIHAASTRHFPASCIHIDSLLHNTPSIPPSWRNLEEFVDANTLCLEGFSVWKLNGNPCVLDNKRSTLSRVVIGSRQPQFCSLSEDFVPDWIGVNSSSSRRGNHLFALVLGWCYVLSARLLETRKASDADKVYYTDNTTTSTVDQATSKYAVLTSFDDPVECRWWAAVLSKGRGWGATVLRDGQEFHSPWSCHLDVEVDFHHDIPPDMARCPGNPPSSAQAQRYLYNFAWRRGIEDLFVERHQCARWRKTRKMRRQPS
jgi:hypothetical protein